MMIVSPERGQLGIEQWQNRFDFQVPQSALSEASPAQVLLSFYEESRSSQSSKLAYRKLGIEHL
jgi:hypothetical protein